MLQLYQIGSLFSEVDGILLAYRHSDHVVGYTELPLSGWIGQPVGKAETTAQYLGAGETDQMIANLPLALEIDIRVRGHGDSLERVNLESLEITEGNGYDDSGITIIAFTAASSQTRMVTALTATLGPPCCRAIPH